MIENLDLYRVFQIVSQNKSFSQAAKELFMTQSAVSQAISRLEKGLEVQLFYRTPKGVMLTTEGKVLQEHVSSALGILDVAEDKIQAYKGIRRGELRIAVGDTISRYFLLPYLEEFHARFPGIKLKVLNGTTPEILGFLKAGEADVGVCNLPIDDEQFEVTPCMEIHDIFVCGDKYKRISKHRISYDHLMELPLISFEKNTVSRDYVDAFFKERGYELSPVFELGSYDLIMDFAKGNLGISCVVREFSREYLNRGIVHEVLLEEEIPSRYIGIVHLKTVPLSRAAAKFVESIKPRI
ncbi:MULTISPECIES: LysR family transcriptional regulator [Oceanobacillus]|uniref:LysR family transcriptional regulator n=1 Tax=Oceanobacillus indicireducens TaxID=1004261 RepID=A0A917XT25_9BACI|nr:MULTISPECIES: LysR family transcriptional regulator [Oceanobacillus]GGN51106.1 LysR family transcriptional regulator [Oceanobacillus indicireducens]